MIYHEIWILTKGIFNTGNTDNDLWWIMKIAYDYVKILLEQCWQKEI